MARRAVFGIVLALATISLLPAAGTTVKTGTIESVSPDGQTITVKYSHADRGTELKTTNETPVRLDGAASELSALKPGMSVTVQVGSDGQVERILARIAKDKPSSPSTSKPAKPKTARKSTKVAKSTKSGSKSSSKSKSNSPSPLDAMPLATTPLSGSDVPERKGSSTFDSLPVVTTPLSNLKVPELKGSSAPAGSKGSWPCFLGANRDNKSKETGLLRRWPPGGPKLAWRASGLGKGYSGVSVADGLVFCMGTPQDQEALLAIDLANEIGRAHV